MCEDNNLDYNKINFSCKRHTNYYEKLLVEDIIADHPVECHYGKCAVIGRFCFDIDKKQYFLESQRITGISTNLQVPNGYYRLRVVTDFLRESLPLGSIVEAFGEVVLWNILSIPHCPSNFLPKTSYDLCLEMQNLQTTTEARLDLQNKGCTGIFDNNMDKRVVYELEKELNRMRIMYEIVLKPRLLVLTSDAANIINLNLETRSVRNNYEEILKQRSII